eukprot:gene8261-14210_t
MNDRSIEITAVTTKAHFSNDVIVDIMSQAPEVLADCMYVAFGCKYKYKVGETGAIIRQSACELVARSWVGCFFADKQSASEDWDASQRTSLARLFTNFLRFEIVFLALKSIKILMARQVYFIVKPIIASLIVVLNVIEIGLLVKHFKRHKATTVCRHAIPIILMADLALSDLLVGVAFVIDICINELIRKKIISINRTNLQILVLFRVVSLDLSMFASCFKTILLTLDRLFAVRFPLAYRSRARNKHAFVLALITWVLSAALIFVPLPIILFNNSIDSFWYHIISIATTVLVATFTLLVCNVMIVKSVRKQGRGLRGIANNSGCYSRKRKSHVNMTPTQSSSDKVGFEHTTVIVRNSDNSIRPLHIVKRELKVFRLPLTLVIAFIDGNGQSMTKNPVLLKPAMLLRAAKLDRRVTFQIISSCQ